MNLTDTIEGWVDPAFAPCLEAFRANFSEGGELGAACAIYVDGRLVLDAWGGVAERDTGQRWRRDTVVPFFSVTKGVAAICVLAQVSRGLLDLDRPVADYWPEFAAHGKGKVTVREALGHRAGIPVIEGAVTIGDLADPRAMSHRLAQERPLFEPGSSHIYHALTIGWITTELVRRAAGHQLGRWFRDELADPLDLNIQIGRTEADRSPIAVVDVPPDRDTPALDPLDFPGSVMSLNGLIVPTMGGLAAAMNDPAIQRIELAGANGLGDARSLARLYAEVLGGSSGERLLSSACLADVCRVVSQGCQWSIDAPGPAWGAGFMLPWHVQPMLGPGSFGHDGAGGSLAFAHAPSGTAFAYVRNRAGRPSVADPLVYRVVEALAGHLGISLPAH